MRASPLPAHPSGKCKQQQKGGPPIWQSPPSAARVRGTRRPLELLQVSLAAFYSGTQAAAAGGYCAILAMPNTDPVVDSASVLGALVDRAREEAVVPTGFMVAISKGQLGQELTEMAELAGAGAAAFTDDGRPVVGELIDELVAATRRAGGQPWLLVRGSRREHWLK